MFLSSGQNPPYPDAGLYKKSPEIIFIKFYIFCGCALVWHNEELILYQKNKNIMNTTDYNINSLSSMISSEVYFQELVSMIDDMGLEIKEVKLSN